MAARLADSRHVLRALRGRSGHRLALTSILAIGVARSVFLGTGAQQTPKGIAVPAAAGRAICHLRAAQGLKTIDLSTAVCPLAPGSVICDFERAEPLEVGSQEVCRTRSLAPVSARLIPIGPNDSAVATVEWLDVPAAGSPRILATRSGLSFPRSLPIAEVATRWVRITAAGLSPVTHPAAPLMNSASWNLPRLPGGELLLGWPGGNAGGVTRYELDGDGIRQSLEPVGPLQPVSGLPPGKYTLTPVYWPDRRGQPLGLNVEAGKSSFAAIPPEPVGAIAPAVPDLLCGKTTHYTVAGPIYMSVPHEGNCERRIGGLKPGRYIVEVFAKRPDGTVSDVVSRTVSVVQHQAAPVKFDSEFAEVSGQVLVNDKPADGYVIEFYRAGSTTAAAPIVGGSYALAAGAPGEYLARLRDRNRTGFGRPAAERAVTLQPGQNTVDWKIEAASVKVRVENWERIRPLEVRVAGIGEAAVLFGSTSVTVPVAESPELTVTGLPFGRYRISASEPVPMRKKTTPSAQVEVTKAKPDLETTLRLSSASVTVTLRDEAGRPVRAPQPPGEELQDGVYLVAAQPGSSIRIRVAGFVSACRVAPSEGAVIDVTLQRGRPRIVTFVPGRPGSVPFMSFMFPGSDCWTSMSVLPFSAVSSEPGQSSFAFADFPAAGPLRILWNRTGQSEVVALSPGAVVVLRPPAGQHP